MELKLTSPCIIMIKDCLVKLNFEFANPTQLQLVGVGMDIVFTKKNKQTFGGASVTGQTHT